MAPTKSQYIPVGFNNATRQSFIQGNPFRYSPNQSDQQQLSPVGFLSKIIIPIVVKFTTGANPPTNLTANDVPSPYGLIRRLSVRANEGAEIYNTSGWGNYLISRTMRDAFDYRNPQPSYGSANSSAGVFNLPASYAANTAYTIRFPLIIPIAWAESLQAGLVLIQNVSTRLTTEIQWGDVTTDMLNMTGATAIDPATVSVQAQPMLEIFNTPEHIEDYPDMSMVRVILDETSPLTTTGDFNYRPNLGNVYMQVLQHFTNNKVSMNPLTDFTSLRLNYMQTQQMYAITPAQQLFIQSYRQGNMSLPDGVWWWDFVFGSGLLEVPNTRDVLDTSQVTDLSIYTGIDQSVTIGANSKVYTVKDMLVRPN